MCGIAGILNVRSEQPVQEEDLRSMCAALRHRGPDDQGLLVLDQVGLAMQRLAIIDLATGQQPIANEDATIWAIQNGEIYNYRELRRDLEARGHIFRTSSDTECIVHLYEEYGAGCVQKLRGMFALAVWDARLQRLLLARDRLGIKPLYYGIFDGKLCFASEVKAILQLPYVPREINWQSFGYYLSAMSTPREESIVVGLHKLEAGHTLSVRPHTTPKIEQYWDIDFTPNHSLQPKEAVEELQRLLEESVRLHMVSDVPIGAFLSGGVDSSAMVAHAAALSNQPIKTFSIGFPDKEYDESAYARMVARALSTEHHELIVQPDVWGILEEMTWFNDEPFGDSSAIPTYLVSRLAADSVKVVLSGDGGDELFGGYDKYRVEQRERRIERVPESLRRVLAGIGQSLPAGTTGRNFLIHHGLSGAARYLDACTLFRPEEQSKLLQTGVREHVASATRNVPQENYTDSHWLSYMQHRDMKNYLPLDILTKVDRMSMAHSLEARPPLLDHHLVEFAARVPASMHWMNRQPKYLLKQAMLRKLPAAVVQRPKRGFAIPLGKWFRGKMQGAVNELLLTGPALKREFFSPKYIRNLLKMHEQGRNMDLHIWSLMAFELWCRHYLDQSTSQAAQMRDWRSATPLNVRRPAS